MNEYTAGTSGAVLGYIVGNVPGAYYGYKAGKKLYQLKQKMAPLKKAYITPPKSTSKKRKLSISSGSSKSTGYRPSRGVYNRIFSGGQVYGMRRRKGIRNKKKKPVKVSSKFKKKVKKVLESVNPDGYFQETFYDQLPLYVTEDNKQNVFNLSGLTGQAADPVFSASRILDAASCLWNDKPMLRTGKQYNDSENFDNQKLKVKVKSSSLTYTIRNNTQRNVTMRIYECTPRSYQVQGDAIGVWNAALNFQNSSSNQNAISLNEIHTSPAMLPDFKRLFKTSFNEYVLAPGTEIRHVVVGPKDYDCNLQKFWNGSTFQPNSPFSKFVFAVYYVDLISETNGSLTPANVFGRYNSQDTGVDSPYGLIVEGVTRFKMEMPDLTGFITPAPYVAGVVQELGQRQFSYAIKTYPLTQTGSGGTTTHTTVLNENPITPVDPYD